MEEDISLPGPQKMTGEKGLKELGEGYIKTLEHL